MSFFFPNIDGCEALLPARQPERKTSSNSKDSTKKLNLVLWCSVLVLVVWNHGLMDMYEKNELILQKDFIKMNNAIHQWDFSYTHTHLSFSVLLIEFLPTLDSWDIGGLWETLNDFERLRYGVSLAQNLERGGSIRERTLTKKTLRERVLRERERWYSRWRANKSYKNTPWAVSAAWKNLTVSSQDWAKHPYTW